jgi:hypothetical protein
MDCRTRIDKCRTRVYNGDMTTTEHAVTTDLDFHRRLAFATCSCGWQTSMSWSAQKFEVGAAHATRQMVQAVGEHHLLDVA